MLTDYHSLPFDSPLPRFIAKTPIAAAAAAIYGSIVTYRNRYYDRRSLLPNVKYPVISVGGIRAGGSGKTPSVILISGILQSLGYEVAVLSRGYKRSVRFPVQLAPNEHPEWKLIGDEPAMIRNNCPFVWLGIGADRILNAKIIQQKMSSKSVFLLDDGFQHRRLHRDLDIVCIHESIFSDRMLPQGFLREPIEELSRAHMFFLIASEYNIERIGELGERLKNRFPATEQFKLLYKKVSWVNLKSGEKADLPPFKTPVALCGIARPERFFETITSYGITPLRKIVFPDHHYYKKYDFYTLRELYSNGVVTTEKDAVRLRDIREVDTEKTWYVKMGLQFYDNESLNRFMHYIKDKIVE